MKTVLVIGGGLAGAAAAFELTRRGVPVHLFEANAELASETSHANGGMMTPSQAEPWNHPGVLMELAASLFNPRAAMKARPLAFLASWQWGLAFLRHSNPHHYGRAMAANFTLAARSAQLTGQWAEAYGMSFSRRCNGTLKVFRTKREMQIARAHAKLLVPFGLQAEELGRKALLDKEPALASARKPLFGGLFYPADSVGDANAFTHALVRQAQNQGLQLHLDCPVKDLLIEGKAVTGVRTAEGEFHGDVVLAAGTASPALARLGGVDLQMAPVKGYSVTIPGLANNSLAPAIAIVDEARHTGVVPIGDDLRLVGTAEIAGFDKNLRKGRMANLHRVLKHLFPELAKQGEGLASDDWAGLRPMTARGIPYIGASGVPGLWLNTGHGHLGWTQAAGSAELLSDLMLGAKPNLAADLFAL